MVATRGQVTYSKRHGSSHGLDSRLPGGASAKISAISLGNLAGRHSRRTLSRQIGRPSSRHSRSQFLQTGGRWEEFLLQFLLHYTGNRGSGARSMMGTILLNLLAEHWRYAHINAIRDDEINPDC